MLRILLHAGFHKSGTTSIQQALSTLAESRIIYPPTFEQGPGHAYLARIAGNPNRPNYNSRSLVDLADHYSRVIRQDRSSVLVFSSENFCNGNSLDGLQLLARSYPVHLVLTRRPVAEALPSLQQELIKQGSRLPYLSEAGLTEAAQHIQFQEKRILHLLDSAKFSQISVISTTLEKPYFLFESIGTILDCRIDGQVLNQRISKSSLGHMTRLNESNPELSTYERMVITGARAESLNPSDQSYEAFLVDDWNAREKKLLRFFRRLSRRGRIAFLESK